MSETHPFDVIEKEYEGSGQYVRFEDYVTEIEIKLDGTFSLEELRTFEIAISRELTDRRLGKVSL